jgi:hypothetical protein
MKISDIFRKLADVIDQEQNPGSPDPRLQNPAELIAVAAPGPYSYQVDAPQNSDAGEACDAAAEEPAHHDRHDHHDHTDELAQMKQLAAIHTQ